ncbi:MAG TPA: hypothetical protein VMT89_09120, partial [Candidatus Acidoferrales bacterium]|nr:hypothetical protein [Candidatus Acidoferrales bacterium]
IVFTPYTEADLGFLHSVMAGIDGLHVPTLVGTLLEKLSQSMSNALTGVPVTIGPKQTGLALKFSAELRKADPRNAYHLKLGSDLGFKVSGEGKISFSTEKLADLVKELASKLLDPKILAVAPEEAGAAGIAAALLSLFTVTSNISQDGHLDLTASNSLELTIVPAFLQNMRLTEVLNKTP